MKTREAQKERCHVISLMYGSLNVDLMEQSRTVVTRVKER